MSVKKDLENTPLGSLVSGLYELAKGAKEFAFKKDPDGTFRAGFPVNASPTLSGKVEIVKSPSGDFSLKWTRSKTVPGEAKRKPRRKPPTEA